MDINSNSFECTGFDAIEAELAKLDAYTQRDTLKAAAKAGAEVVAAGARRNAPRKSGKLVRAIRVRPGRSKNGSFSMLASVGKKFFTGDEFYGGFQEFGHKTGKRGSKNRGEVPGEHYMEYAFDELKDQALKAM